MRDEESRSHQEIAREFLTTATEALQEQDLEEAIAPGTRQILHQLREIEKLTLDVHAMIADRVRASLLQLMQQEVRRTFERALGSSSESLLDSVLKRTGSAAEPRYQGGHGGMPEDGEPTPQYRPALRQAMDPDAMLAHRKPSSALLEREEPTLYRGTSRPGTAALAEPQPEAVIQALAVVEALDRGTARPEAPGPSAEDEVYEGNVRLSVQATGGMREVVHFVDGLREKPHFRLFQLVGSRKEAADILLGLREPMPLKRLLRQMPGVSQVAAPAGRSPAGVEPLISVRLGDASASALLS